MSLKEFAEKVCSNLGMFYYFAFDCSFFLPVMIFGLQQNTATAEKKRYVDGTEIKTFPLMAGEESNTYTYKDEHGDYNLIEIDGDRVRIKKQIAMTRSAYVEAGQRKWRNHRLFAT